jgi:hypothetical protein
MNDENERSVASAGSVAEGLGLVAAMIQTDARGKVQGIRHQPRDTFPPNELIPLYLSPQLSLTEAEREAVEASFDAMQYAADELGLSQADCDRMVATLRGLLERLK